MKLVIKLDDKIYQDIIEGNRRERYSIVMYDFPITIADAIAEGTPLRKGHGRLIDADALITELETDYHGTLTESGAHLFVGITNYIDDAETIIEADKESNDGTDN